MIVTRWSAVALVIGVASACDYTPDPTPVPSPSVTGGSTAPVVVVPAPTVTPIPTISPVPVPSSAFKIVLATPEDTSIIRLPSDPSVKVPRPILEFEFTYPQSLTLDSTHTDIEIGLRSRTFECLWTDVDYITRLDRDDAVYIANTVARFRTGPWRRRNPSSGCAPNRFTTDQVAFVLWTTPGEGTPYVVPMGWSFVPN